MPTSQCRISTKWYRDFKIQVTPQLTPARQRRLPMCSKPFRIIYGGEWGPVTFPAFKAGDSSLRGWNGGFDFHTPPPNCFDCNQLTARTAVQSLPMCRLVQQTSYPDACRQNVTLNTANRFSAASYWQPNKCTARISNDQEHLHPYLQQKCWTVPQCSLYLDTIPRAP